MCSFLPSLRHPLSFRPALHTGVRWPSGATCRRSPRPAQLKEARPHLAFGSYVLAQGGGVTADGSVGPGFLPRRPRATQCPIVPQPLEELPQDAEAQAGGASYFGCRGKTWVCLWEHFSQGKGQWTQPGGHVGPIGSNSQGLPASLPKTGGARCLQHQAAPRQATAFSALSRWVLHCPCKHLSPLGNLCNFGGPNRGLPRTQNPPMGSSWAWCSAPVTGLMAPQTQPSVECSFQVCTSPAQWPLHSGSGTPEVNSLQVPGTSWGPDPTGQVSA